MTIDLTDVGTRAAFYRTMKSQLDFPERHGENRDATAAVVEMPDCVVLQHWERFAQACLKDMLILRDIIANYPQEKPGKQLLLGS